MYKRPAPKAEGKPHPINAEFQHYGFINTEHDQPWISPHLEELMNDGRFALHQFSRSIDDIINSDWNDFKPEIAKQKKAELILKSKRALMSFLKKHIEGYKGEINAVYNSILRVTEPAQPSDPMKLMLQEMRLREIRENLKNIEPKRRRESIAGSLERLQAVISNPDPNDIIIDQNALTELRREYAFKQDPSLIKQEKDQQKIYKAVRARAADINATAAKMLIYSKLDDPLPPAEHFEVFTPQDDHELEIANRRIQQWQKDQDKAERQKLFDERQAGFNLEAGARAERLSKGMPH